MMKTLLKLQDRREMITRRICLPRIRVLVLFLTLIILAVLPAQRAYAANVFTVTNTNSGGTGSLYQAMQDAINADAGPALIAFNIPKSDPGYGLHTPGVWTIHSLGLPTLTVGLITIDGKTQITNQGDTNSGLPNVEIDESDKYADPEIFRIESGYNTIQWLVLNGAYSIGVDIAPYCIANECFNPSSNYIQYNYIGTDATGTLAPARMA